MRKILIIVIFLAHTIHFFSQNIISGKVTDLQGEPLEGTAITIPEINAGTFSGNGGIYELKNLPNGKFKLIFSFLGYKNKIEVIILNGQPVLLNTSLESTVIETEEVVVTGGYSSTQHENAVKIDVLKLNQLENRVNTNLASKLTIVPGVDMISKGNGIAKPMIRGLSMNDILILNNGVRYENYQYSNHHPLGISEAGIESVEIVKGPASLLYGSDAIGGVINFIKEKPAAQKSIEGDYNLELFSNSLGINQNLGIKGASEKLFGGIRVGQNSHADYLQGGGSFVPNSRSNEFSVNSNIGTTTKQGVFKLFYDYNTANLGLVEEEAIDEITFLGRKTSIYYQNFNTHLLSSQNKIYLNTFKLDLNAAYQNTELAHIAEKNEYEIQMALATTTYEAKLYLPSSDKSEYIVGFQGMNQKNSNIKQRPTILLPDANTDNYSIFGLLQRTLFQKLKLQTGIRYDYRSITTEAIGVNPDSTNFRAALNRNYNSISWSAGATYPFSDKLLIRANIASAFRTPNLAELTSNGPHEAVYELGDKNLTPEKSYEADFSLHYHQENYTIDAAVFYNIINNYIFISPTGLKALSGLPIYKYMQQNSSLYGGEAGIHFHPENIKWLHVESSFSTVTGKQKNGNYLPFIPAKKIHFDVKAESGKILFFQNANLAIENHLAFAQHNTAPEESATPSYFLQNISIGGNTKIAAQQMEMNLSINNVFDKKYTDHLSTLKEVNRFNPGRNVILSVKWIF